MTEKKQTNPKTVSRRNLNGNLSRFWFVNCCLFVALIYFLSNPKPQVYFDYTFRVAENFSHGKIGIEEAPPLWLSEIIESKGLYYSAFPLGAVLSYLPFAMLKTFGLITQNPAAWVVAGLAGFIAALSLQISRFYELTSRKRILLTAMLMFGTWMWTNLCFGGAWQIALGFAVLGQFGAIYNVFYVRQPFLAGFFFALAFGNRTEILLTAPIFIFLLARNENFNFASDKIFDENDDDFKSRMIRDNHRNRRSRIFHIFCFCAVPFMLGVATLVYNYVRFDSFADFGYQRIPNVLNEPWYRYGIFSLAYIPANFQAMLLMLWNVSPNFPYLVPNGFGCAIWLSSPFLMFLFRWKVRNKTLWRIAWVAVFVLTFLLWIHGNTGGWQFSYRYAMVLLPWIFLILLENSEPKIKLTEIFAYGIAFFVNVWATYLFFWTDYVKL